jgi:predicted CoA-binding protein
MKLRRLSYKDSNFITISLRLIKLPLSTEKSIMKNKKTLVLGATANPARYACMAINRLVDAGHSVVGIGLKEEEVAGVKIHTKQIPLKNIDTVTLYLNPSRQRDYYNYIIDVAPKRVIFNPGTENPEFYQLLRANGIEVEVACTLVLISINRY